MILWDESGSTNAVKAAYLEMDSQNETTGTFGRRCMQPGYCRIILDFKTLQSELAEKDPEIDAERQRKKAALILKLILIGIFLILCGAIFFSLRSSEQRLTETIGRLRKFELAGTAPIFSKMADKIEELTKPLSGTDKTAMVSIISNGETVAEIAAKLSDLGILRIRSYF